MKKLLPLTILVSSSLCISSLGGSPDYKPVAAPAPPPAVCGGGWSIGIDGGANVDQDFGGGHNLGGEFNDSNIGQHLVGAGMRFRF